MPIILSLSSSDHELWASGPEGLFAQRDGVLQPVPQPQAQLTCCVLADDCLLVGGAPHGVAFSPDHGQTWQAGWMDGVTDRVICLAADPRVAETGVVLAGSEDGGILRTANRGAQWAVCNFGLHNFNVLCLAWAPVAPAQMWPRWEVVFAGAEDGLYRSPNGGRGWRRCAGIDGVVLTVAVAPDYYRSGLVLAGTEDAGLWRSTDGGHRFDPVRHAPQAINALAVGARSWLLSDALASGAPWTA